MSLTVSIEDMITRPVNGRLFRGGIPLHIANHLD